MSWSRPGTFLQHLHSQMQTEWECVCTGIQIPGRIGGWQRPGRFAHGWPPRMCLCEASDGGCYVGTAGNASSSAEGRCLDCIHQWGALLWPSFQPAEWWLWFAGLEILPSKLYVCECFGDMQFGLSPQEAQAVMIAERHRLFFVHAFWKHAHS